MRPCRICETQKIISEKAVQELIAEQLSLEPNLARPEIVSARLEKCEDCATRSAHTCTKCGCFYAFRAQLPQKKCPLGKW